MMSRVSLARPLHTAPSEAIEQYVVRHAESELRSLRRRLGLDPEWEARRASIRWPHGKRPVWLPKRPQGRSERWLRTYYVNRAIDRLRAEEGLTVHAACHQVADVLLRGPWSPDRLSDTELSKLFPSATPAEFRSPLKLREKLANTIRVVYDHYC